MRFPISLNHVKNRLRVQVPIRVVPAIFIAAILVIGFSCPAFSSSSGSGKSKQPHASDAHGAGDSSPQFFLRPKDIVVFLGDSITALNTGTWPAGTTQPNYTYCADIVSWVVTHRPNDHIVFYDLGVPGDTAQGDVWPAGGPSSAGVPPNQSIDQHLRYAESLNPTVVTINLGMNDGEYVDCDPADEGYNGALYHSFTSGMTHIVTALLAWSGANRRPLRIVVLSPSYYDNACRVAKGWKFWWGPPVADYNQTLLAFGEWEKSYVVSLSDPNVTFIDLNAPMLAATTKLPAGQSLTQEGIHPTEQGYEVVAATILDAWNAGVKVTADDLSTQDMPTGAAVPWALFNGGTAYEICPLLSKVDDGANPAGDLASNGQSVADTKAQDAAARENSLIGLIRDQFVGQEASVVKNFTVPPWNPAAFYQTSTPGAAQPPAR